MKKLIAIILFTTTAHAKVLDFKPVSMEVKAKDQLSIVGFDGSVKLREVKGNKVTVKVKQENPDKMSSALKESLDEWQLLMQRQGDTLEIHVKGPESKSTWTELMRASAWPKFYLEVSSPSLPLTLVWRKGNVKVENWNAPAKLSILDGEVVVQNGDGDLQLIHQTGEVKAIARKGKTELESFSGKVLIDGGSGLTRVENFAGDTTVKNFDGTLEWRANRGVGKVNGGKGKIDFQTEKGSLVINDYKGDLHGQSSQGSITADLISPAQVRITTVEAPVSLKVAGSGALVNLISDEGVIAAPSSLEKSGRQVRGRLKSGTGEGSIFVKTASGAIRLR